MYGNIRKLYQCGHVIVSSYLQMHLDSTFFLPFTGLRPTHFKMSLNRKIVVESMMDSSLPKRSINWLSDKTEL